MIEAIHETAQTIVAMIVIALFCMMVLILWG